MNAPSNLLEEHSQWNAVKEVCSRLRDAGFEALLAGGCVRDLIMHREPNDFDVATDATPDQIESLFPKCLLVGKAFGVIILPFDGFQIEVATFREDLQYKDGRRPEGVKFSTPKADAQRRDFTINALFYDPIKREIIDFIDGQADIKAKILRTVGDPNHRFDEDKLRLLRAIRFAAQLDFRIEDGTLRAVETHAKDVSVVSHERIRDELIKLLKSPNRNIGLELLLSTGVLKGAMPELATEIEAKAEEWLRAFAHFQSNSPDDLAALIALFIWPALEKSPKILPKILKGFRLDNQLSEAVALVLRHLEVLLNPSTVRKGDLALILTKSFAPSLLLVADALVRAEAVSHELYDLEAWNEALKVARPDGVTPVMPLVTGKDLMQMGLTPGPEIGERLQEIFLLQLEGTLKTRADVEAWIRKN